MFFAVHLKKWPRKTNCLDYSPEDWDIVFQRSQYWGKLALSEEFRWFGWKSNEKIWSGTRTKRASKRNTKLISQIFLKICFYVNLKTEWTELHTGAI